MAHCRTIHGGIELENVQIDRFDERLTEKIDQYSQILGGVDSKLKKIQALQQLIEYFKILQQIEDVRYVRVGPKFMHNHLYLIGTFVRHITAMGLLRVLLIKTIQKPLHCICNCTRRIAGAAVLLDV